MTFRKEKRRCSVVSKYDLRTVRRALDVLEVLSDAGALTLEALARRTGVPKPTVFGVVRTLEERGYMVRGPSGTLGLGPRVLSLAGGERKPWVVLLREVARPEMVRWRDALEDTVNLAVRAAGHVVYVDVVEGTYPVRFVESPGALGPLHATALGKVLLAFLPPAEREELLLELPLARLTGRTIVDREQLQDELRKVREKGFAVDDEESVEGARCVAAPVLVESGRGLAAISVSAPAGRLGPARLSLVRSHLVDACAKISERLTAGGERHA